MTPREAKQLALSEAHKGLKKTVHLSDRHVEACSWASLELFRMSSGSDAERLLERLWESLPNEAKVQLPGDLAGRVLTHLAGGER